MRLRKETLEPWRAQHDLYNFLDSPADGDAMFSPDSYSRLRQIKAQYDPDNVFHLNVNIEPAAAVR